MSHVGGSGVGLFPLPVIEMPLRSHSHSRRVISRYHTAVNTTVLANRTIHALNHVNTSFTTTDTSSYSSHLSFSNSFIQARNLPPSSSQQRLHSHIHSCVSRYIRRQCHDNEMNLHNDNIMSSSDDLCHFFDASLSYASLKSSALRIVADKVSLPSSPGTANLLSLLPPSLRLQYSTPHSLIRPPHERQRSPRVMLSASPSEYVALITRMYSIGMIDFVLKPEVVNGVFAVEKDGDKQRLIIDARPANNVFIDPPKVSLPTPDLLSQLVVPSSRPFYVAKVDLDNFYHRLTLPEWIRPYFALPPVRASAVGLSHIYVP
jgi:hypothetical protein